MLDPRGSGAAGDPAEIPSPGLNGTVPCADGMGVNVLPLAALLVLAPLVPAQRSPTPTHPADRPTPAELGPAVMRLLDVPATAVAGRPVVPWASLGLGAGGFGPAAVAVPGGLDRNPAVTFAATPGGALIRVRAEGVKLDFPSGAELLVAPDGFVHRRRGGNAVGIPAGPFPRGLELLLADGTALRIEVTGGVRSSIEQVGVVMPPEPDPVTRGRRGPRGGRISGSRVSGGRASETQRLLWFRGRPAERTLRVRPHTGVRLLALGDGADLFHGVVLGPAVFLEHVDAPPGGGPLPDIPAASEAGHRKAPPPPVRALAVWTAPLRESIRLLARKYTGPNSEYPGLDKLAARLAAGSRRILPGAERLLRVRTKPLEFQVGGGCTLRPGMSGMRRFQLGLVPADSERPLLEWEVDRRTDLQLLRPTGQEGENLRYFQRGLDVPAADCWAMPQRTTADDIDLVQRVLGQLTAQG